MWTAETDVTHNVILFEQLRQRVDYHFAHNVIQHNTDNGDVTTQTVYNPIGEPVEGWYWILIKTFFLIQQLNINML